MNEKKAMLLLYRSKHIGTIGFRYLIDNYGSALEAIKHIDSISFKWKGKKCQLASEIAIDTEIERLRNLGADFMSYKCSEFPQNLRHNPYIAPILSYKGNLNLLKNPTISVIGTRNPSTNGIIFTKQMVRELSNRFINVASGMALGIDSVAHENSLDTGTTAVIPCGLDVCYPPDNEILRNSIVQRGLLLSDCALGASASNHNFHSRNKIVALIGFGLVVVEAPANSGTLSTAYFALNNNQNLFVCPGHPYDKQYKGNLELIKKGANVLIEVNDLFKSTNVQEKRLEFTMTKPTDKDREFIYNKISVNPCAIDDLVNLCPQPTSIVLSVIAELEIAGKVHIDGDSIARLA